MGVVPGAWHIIESRLGKTKQNQKPWSHTVEFCCCSVAKSCSTLCVSWTAVPWTRLLCPLQLPGVCSNSCPLSWWCYLTISSSATPFSFAFNLLQHRVFSSELALCIRWPTYWSFSFSISPSNEYFRADFLYGWLVWYPCSPRESQESSLWPVFKNVSSSVLSLLCGPTLISVHDYWKA